MTNLNIHKFSVDQASGNVESVTFVRDDGTLQTLNNENQTISASFTENGTYIPPTGFTGFDSVEIDVPPSGKLETITVELDSDAQTIRPSVGFDGIGEVRVPKSNLQSLSVQLTPNQQTIVAADNNKFGYSEVTIPGYSSLFATCSTQDLEDAGIGLGLTQTITPDRIYGPDTAIEGFSSFQIPPAILQAKEIDLSTSEQTIRPTDGAYGLSEVIVPSVYEVFTDEVTITENGDNITPPSPYLGFGKFNVRVPVPTVQDETVISAQITQNGTHSYVPSTGYDATKKVTVTVNVPVPRVQSSKNVGTITENGSFTIDPDSGYDVMGEVTGTVAVPVPKVQSSKTVSITTNNSTTTVTPDSPNDVLGQVVVETHIAQGNIQASKSVTYTNNGVYHVYPDAGYDGLLDAQVTVNVSASFNWNIPTNITLHYYYNGGGSDMSISFVDSNGNITDDINQATGYYYTRYADLFYYSEDFDIFDSTIMGGDAYVPDPSEDSVVTSLLDLINFDRYS